MIRRPPRSTLDRSSAASDVYKRQGKDTASQAFDKGLLNAKFDKASPRAEMPAAPPVRSDAAQMIAASAKPLEAVVQLSLIHISEPTRPY